MGGVHHACSHRTPLHSPHVLLGALSYWIVSTVKPQTLLCRTYATRPQCGMRMYLRTRYPQQRPAMTVHLDSSLKQTSLLC